LVVLTVEQKMVDSVEGQRQFASLKAA
jgi:hypothetical protein